MTAWASVELAVEAMRRGARDFVQKPWDNARLLAILSNQVQLRRGSAQRAAAGSGEPPAAARRGAPSRLIAESSAMQPVLQLIAQGWPFRCQRLDHRRARDR